MMIRLKPVPPIMEDGWYKEWRNWPTLCDDIEERGAYIFLGYAYRKYSFGSFDYQFRTPRLQALINLEGEKDE